MYLSELELMDSKRPRLDLLPTPLLRPAPLLATGQPGLSDDLAKVGPSLTHCGAVTCSHTTQERGQEGDS